MYKNALSTVKGKMLSKSLLKTDNGVLVSIIEWHTLLEGERWFMLRRIGCKMKIIQVCGVNFKNRLADQKFKHNHRKSEFLCYLSMDFYES